MAEAKPVYELETQTRTLAIAAFTSAHGSAPDIGFATDRAWIEGWAYAQTAAPAPAAVAVSSKIRDVLEEAQDALAEVVKGIQLPRAAMAFRKEVQALASVRAALAAPQAQPLEAAAEHQALRDVYEQARGVLRHDGVDQQRALEYRDGLIEAIEAVKAIDGGNWEAEAPMSDDDAAELILETMAVHCDKDAWHQAIEVHKVLLSRYVESAPQAQDVQDAEAVKAARNAGINHGVCLALQIMHAAGDAGSTQWNELLDTAGREEVTNYAKVIEPDEWVLCGFAQVAEWKAEFDAIAASAAKGGE